MWPSCFKTETSVIIELVCLCDSPVSLDVSTCSNVVLGSQDKFIVQHPLWLVIQACGWMQLYNLKNNNKSINSRLILTTIHFFYWQLGEFAPSSRQCLQSPTNVLGTLNKKAPSGKYFPFGNIMLNVSRPPSPPKQCWSIVASLQE